MEEPFPDSRCFIRRIFIYRGLPEVGFEILIHSIAPSTLRQYESCYRRWWLFNNKLETSPFIYNFNAIITFLNEQVTRGTSYSLINCYSSALHFIFDFPFQDDKVLKRFLKGVEKSRPLKPRYQEIWDTSPVLELLAKWYPLETLCLQKLTFKPHRLQTLTKIRVDNINFFPRIEILITDVIKTSFSNRTTPLLVLPYFAEKPELCVTLCLKTYLSVTDGFGTNCNFLLLTLKPPVHHASSQTLSRWVKSVLKESGIDTSIYSGYSIRHASTSAAFRAGVDIDEIRRTAGWSLQSNTFNKFYNRPVLAKKSSSFAFKVLNTTSSKQQ